MFHIEETKEMYIPVVVRKPLARYVNLPPNLTYEDWHNFVHAQSENAEFRRCLIHKVTFKQGGFRNWKQEEETR